MLIEAGKKGGSIEAGRSVLKLNRLLYVPFYGNMLESSAGNRELLELGAISLLKDKETGRANLSHLITNLRSFTCSDNVSSQQPTFL